MWHMRTARPRWEQGGAAHPLNPGPGGREAPCCPTTAVLVVGAGPTSPPFVPSPRRPCTAKPCGVGAGAHGGSRGEIPGGTMQGLGQNNRNRPGGTVPQGRAYAGNTRDFGMIGDTPHARPGAWKSQAGSSPRRGGVHRPALDPQKPDNPNPGPRATRWPPGGQSTLFTEIPCSRPGASAPNGGGTRGQGGNPPRSARPLPQSLRGLALGRGRGEPTGGRHADYMLARTPTGGRENLAKLRGTTKRTPK